MWAETRQKRNDNEKIQQSIRETERKIQENKERQLKLQKVTYLVNYTGAFLPVSVKTLYMYLLKSSYLT